MPSISASRLDPPLADERLGVDHQLDAGAAQVVGDADRELRRHQRALHAERSQARARHSSSSTSSREMPRLEQLVGAEVVRVEDLDPVAADLVRRRASVTVRRAPAVALDVEERVDDRPSGSRGRGPASRSGAPIDEQRRRSCGRSLSSRAQHLGHVADVVAVVEHRVEIEVDAGLPLEQCSQRRAGVPRLLREPLHDPVGVVALHALARRARAARAGRTARRW